EIRLRQRFTREQVEALEGGWSPTEPLGLNRAMLQENRELLAQFGQALKAVSAGQATERTKWTLAGHLDPFDQGKALEAAAMAGRAAGAVARVAERFAAMG